VFWGDVALHLPRVLFQPRTGEEGGGTPALLHHLLCVQHHVQGLDVAVGDAAVPEIFQDLHKGDQQALQEGAGGRLILPLELHSATIERAQPQPAGHGP
jgi:hypothetical protein